VGRRRLVPERDTAGATAAPRAGDVGRPSAASDLKPIGAVAREVGLTARAIRYYEEAGLLRPAIRVKGSDRLFDASDVQRLQEIKRMREVIGFSIAEIRELLDTDEVRQRLRERYHGTTDAGVHAQVIRDAIALSERRLAIVQHKLEQVAAVRDEETERLARLQRMLLEAEGNGSPDRAGHERRGEKERS
jgi:MerR family transcriptional regulator, repressor of the yfmOP operon